ncbi:MAG: DUF192 domain-containing protein, partial [Undibacterium sp.]|nr:DUF192 domain-containing protein [Undibacterium sp.]
MIAMQNIYIRTLSLALILFIDSSMANAQTKLPVKPLSIGIYAIQAEVAATDSARQQGLMMRTKMGASEGMVFD